MTHGLIYKIQRKGAQSPPSADLSRKTTQELVKLLKTNNPWWHRTALRLLAERRDRSVASQLEELLQEKDDTLCLRGVWGLYGIGALDESSCGKALRYASPWVRSWAVRLVGEATPLSAGMLEKLTQMAAQDPAAPVRLQLASTAQRLRDRDTVPLLHHLMQHKADAHDAYLP